MILKSHTALEKHRNTHTRRAPSKNRKRLQTKHRCYGTMRFSTIRCGVNPTSTSSGRIGGSHWTMNGRMSSGRGSKRASRCLTILIEYSVMEEVGKCSLKLEKWQKRQELGRRMVKAFPGWRERMRWTYQQMNDEVNERKHF